MTATIVALAWATPSKAEALFDGVMTFTGVTSPCSGGPFDPIVGHNYTGQFHPRTVLGVAQTLPFASLNFCSEFQAYGFLVKTGGNFPNTFVSPSPIQSDYIGWSHFNPAPAPDVAIISQGPATISTTTPQVTLVGKISNPNGNSSQASCVASFLFVGVSNPQ